MKISEIKENPRNPRKISTDHLEKLVKSIKDDPEMMSLRPIVYDPETMEVLGGNQRLAALKKAGYKEIPEGWAVPADKLTAEQKKRFILKDNANLGEWDFEVLSMEFGDFDFADIGIEVPEIQLDNPKTEADAEPQIDRAVELQKQWGTKLGQVWRCGKHRIMCGDSTSRDDVNRLLNNNKPGLMVTDPPYGVEYDAKWREKSGLNPAGGAGRKVKNDSMADWTEAWKLSPSDVCYVYHADRYSPIVHNSLLLAGYEPINLIIWNKNRLVIGRGNYHHKHEPVWYMVRKNKNHGWAGSRKESTVWDIDRNSKNESGHSTQKPIECMQIPIANHTFTEVYDPFLGSGTTIVACENLKRICYGMELDPAYIAVSLQRYKDLTGEIPILELDPTKKD